MTDKTVDARGLNCPMPILRAKKALKEIPVGGALEVLATDPGSMSDFDAFAKQTGDELVSAERLETHFRYVIIRRS
jgi:tRNA 2-thiouridine synthesizing protein A